MLKPIAYLFDIEKSLSIYGAEDKIGSLNIEIYPCNSEGTKIDEDDFEDDLLDPMQLVKQRFDFTIRINDGQIEEDFSKDSYVEYKLYINGEKKYYQTEICKGKNTKPLWNYNMQHTIHSMNQVDISYLCETKLQLSLYALQDSCLNKKSLEPFIDDLQPFIVEKGKEGKVISTGSNVANTQNVAISPVKAIKQQIQELQK